MSGGHFNPINTASIADELETLVELEESNKGSSQYISEDLIELYKDLNPETKKEIKEAIRILRLASIYVTRIDYLFSGDDGEESFHKRLKEECEVFLHMERS